MSDVEPSAPFPLSMPGAAADRTAWEHAAAAVLRKSGRLGAEDPDDKVWSALTRSTLDGIGITPLGTPDLVAGGRDDSRPPARPGGVWDVRVACADPDPATTAQHALTDLENGATSLWLQVGPGGLAPADLASALEGVLLDAAAVVVSGGLPGARAFVDVLTARGLTPASGSNLGADPLGDALRTDDSAKGPADVSDLLATADLAREHGLLAACVDGTAVHDRGGSDAQELGWVVAVGTAYLRALEEAGVEAPADLIELRLAATDEQFPTIAKFRAVRRLWNRVLKLSDLQAPTRVHAVTSRPMMSQFDPYVNMLRTCVAAFAAGVGGADAVTVLPFDAPLGLPDPFSRRIARNTSALLTEESHVAKVSDPAGGAYAVEKLTDDLAEAGWAFLQVIEEAGGAAAALDLVRARIAETAAARDVLVAKRRRPLTGLSEFPHLEETPLERRDYAAGALPVRGYGHAFEAMRREPAGRPVFLATMGPVAAHTARATFAANLLAAGGIDVVSAGATDSIADVVGAYGQQPVACLCGTDAAYSSWGADLVKALREAGATRVIVAGKTDMGQDDSCAMGVDALDFLTRTREALQREALR